MPKSGPSKLTPSQQEDQQRLQDLVQRAHEGLQAEVAGDLEITPGAVSQVVKGHRPLNLSMAVAFAHRLRIKLDAISPELAADAAHIAAVASGAKPPVQAEWPFRDVSPTQWEALDGKFRETIILTVKTATAVPAPVVTAPKGRQAPRPKSGHGHG